VPAAQITLPTAVWLVVGATGCVVV